MKRHKKYEMLQRFRSNLVVVTVFGVLIALFALTGAIPTQAQGTGVKVEDN